MGQAGLELLKAALHTLHGLVALSPVKSPGGVLVLVAACWRWLHRCQSC
jgi:hypothetical protein